MVVYEIMEHTCWGEDYSWGVYSSEENANLYLETMDWDNDIDFEIVPYVVDENLKGLIL